ncbi:hypothetical protein [Pararhodospirillum oryzae]|uniref:Major facilitator superfamily (MFS) profile domain-containing protein n=1 Tax=Pararhodospirillum oryzae TaxID=478448 RepID=A0A512H5C9_9PROT|nr:hypothetical protein [Pararhodospirillum oryzae]GEO80624.1 hypothetical protein ROR02_07550 [Pararhodospirillum oryzae]
MSLIQNERTKLLATALNNIGVAIIVTGVVAPAVATLYGGTLPGAGHWWFVVAAGWLLAGIGLHILAHINLGRLKP